MRTPPPRIIDYMMNDRMIKAYRVFHVTKGSPLAGGTGNL